MVDVRGPRSAEVGFTLIEMLIVIAMIGILAAIALPMFLTESRKAKGNTEVHSYFADLHTRLANYLSENGQYPADTDQSEATTWPVTPGVAQQAIYPWPASWDNLRMSHSAESNVYCGYTWVTGLANDATNIGPIATSFGFTVPTIDWYYIIAHCDLDGNPGVDTYYFASNIDPTVLSQNEGN
jgi:prepilin-type N-terminal cleavage/methylation domain-containing protein